MFRCITELKGLVVDVDSIYAELNEWAWVFEKYQCVFITSKEDNARRLKVLYGENCVNKIEDYLKFFSPSPAMHEEALRRMNLKTTEIAYVTGDKEFCNNAMAFLCGAIWITKEKITYEDVSIAPDLICQTFASFKARLEERVYGFYGEVIFSTEGDVKGYILPVMLETDEEFLYVFMLGRYFGYSHYMNQLHPYSSAIYLNKREGRAFGVLDERFAKLYSAAVNRIKKSKQVDAVCSVPVSPGKQERFRNILQRIASLCEVEDISSNFYCVSDYPTQKNLSETARQENVKGIFQYKGDLNGKNVVIIDDIVTTGATIKECIKKLKQCGADNVYIVALGVNQKKGTYWSSTVPQVSCQECGEKMNLFINSMNKQFFYSCPGCNKTVSYEEGNKLLCNQVNSEFDII